MDIKRIKNKNRFQYILTNGNKLTDINILNRINTLAIPPSWDNVEIAIDNKQHIQAIGKDSKNRVQYIYSKEWIYNQEKEKFNRLIYFIKNINIIRKNINKELKCLEWSKNKLIAFIIKIIDICGLRIGNLKYNKLYDTYGISTLKKKHINICHNKIVLEFIGKKNVVNNCVITKPTIIKLFISLNNINKPKNEDFFFILKDDKKIISNCLINNYLKDYGDYTVKDFRTYRSNVEFIKCLTNIDVNLNLNLKKNINKCLDIIADKLNNTRIVLKNKYIYNITIDKYLDDPILFLKKYKYYKKKNLNNLNEYESLLMYYLKK